MVPMRTLAFVSSIEVVALQTSGFFVTLVEMSRNASFGTDKTSTTTTDCDYHHNLSTWVDRSMIMFVK